MPAIETAAISSSSCHFTWLFSSPNGTHPHVPPSYLSWFL
jgi:hypothetical protein